MVSAGFMKDLSARVRRRARAKEAMIETEVFDDARTIVNEIIEISRIN